MSETRCGYVAIIGRPNVGKSTLINKLLGKKLNIATSKPQTTRHRILGIKTVDQQQFIYVDTPGIHKGEKRALNQYMNRAANYAMLDADINVLLIDGLNWTDGDEAILYQLRKAKRPFIVAINKIDRVKPKEKLLPFLQHLHDYYGVEDIVPISASKGTNLDELEKVVAAQLPEGPFFFEQERMTDRSDRFLAAEFIREQLLLRYSKEIPYDVAVEIEEFEPGEKILKITALIYVEREGQKKILIGKKGAGLKEVGENARIELERMFGQKIFLKLWVKVREGWSNDERALRNLGYE